MLGIKRILARLSQNGGYELKSNQSQTNNIVYMLNNNINIFLYISQS